MTTARCSWSSIDTALRLKVCAKKARSQTRARTHACTGPEVLPDMRDARREQVERLARQRRDATRDRHESGEVAVA